MKYNDLVFYCKMLDVVAGRSYCKKAQVGALVIAPDGINILAYGYNGQPSGFVNCCEDESGKTLPTTIHAEVNAIAKCAQLGHSTDNATMLISLSPCVNCAVLILQSGIKEVYYKRNYKDMTGVDLLRRSGVKVEQLGA
jgi:dCMP deaminase